MQLFKVLVKFGKPHFPNFLTAAILQAAQAICSLYMPELLSHIVNDGVAKGDQTYILSHGLNLLAITVLQVGLTIAATWFGSRFALSLARDLRIALFAKIGTFSSQEVGRFSAASLITRSSSDVTQIQTVATMAVVMLLPAPVSMIGGIVLAMRQNVHLSVVFFTAVPLLAVVIGFLMWRVTPIFRSMQERIDSMNLVLREQIGGVRVVRSSVKESTEEARFESVNRAVMQASLGAGVVMAWLRPVMTLVVGVSQLAIVWVSAPLIMKGDMEVGSIVAFIGYLMQILMAVMMTSFMLMVLPRSQVSAQRVKEVLDAEPAMHSATSGLGAVDLVAQTQELTFDRVCFQYPGAAEPVLQDASFSLRPGRVTAMIGATGSGKSTLVNIAARLDDPTAGVVRWGELDVRQLDPDQYRRRLGVVPQQTYLFSGTVASNLRFGREDASDADLWQALRIAQAEDFVRDLPLELAATIQQGGSNLSGGQKQRLAIARAVLRRPDYFVFDDSFSALDALTDRNLRSALNDEMNQAGVLLVSQRVATVRDADEILVLDAGRIVGRGAHDDLLASCRQYQDIASSQVQAEEVQ